ncbi:MAG: hypothetical protein AAF850_02965 [Pseudomonadota bacterium]
MRTFAVILAAIAAIAATAQAYLIWRDSVPEITFREANRIRTCQILIEILSDYERIVQKAPQEIQLYVAARERDIKDQSNYQDDFDLDKFREKETRSAKVDVLDELSNGTFYAKSSITNLSLYFTTNETEEIGLSDIKAALFADSIFRSSLLRGENFEEAIPKYKKAADRLPAVMQLCKPILTTDVADRRQRTLSWPF